MVSGAREQGQMGELLGLRTSAVEHVTLLASVLTDPGLYPKDSQGHLSCSSLVPKLLPLPGTVMGLAWGF